MSLPQPASLHLQVLSRLTPLDSPTERTARHRRRNRRTNQRTRHPVSRTNMRIRVQMRLTLSRRLINRHSLFRTLHSLRRQVIRLRILRRLTNNLTRSNYSKIMILMGTIPRPRRLSPIFPILRAISRIISIIIKIASQFRRLRNNLVHSSIRKTRRYISTNQRQHRRIHVQQARRTRH